MNIYCKASNCRFNTTHTTRAHKCGNCNEYGHGQLECYSISSKENLKKYWNDIIDQNERCTIEGCNNYYHKTIAHPCNICQDYGHNTDNCPNDNRTKTLNCPICRTLNTIKIKQKKIKGLEETCCICIDNKVEVFLQECGHVCICYDCFISI